MTSCQTKYSFIVSFRDDGRGRWDNLLAVLNWYSGLTDTELLLVEQDERTRIDSSCLPESVNHLFIYNPGSFNKSWAFNVGAMRARGTVLGIVDADLLVEAAVIQECFEQCHAEFQAVNPYAVLVDLDRERTNLFQRTSRLSTKGEDTLNRDYKGEYLCFCGGLYVVRKDAYLEVGGRDERFLGWGGEDDAMSVKLELLGNIAVNRSAVAYHLFHDPTLMGPGSRLLYRKNLALLEEYRRMTKTELWILCKQHRQTMGNPDKYAGRRTSA